MKSLLSRKIPPRTALAVVALVLLASVVSGRERRDLPREGGAESRAAAPDARAQPALDFDPQQLKRAATQAAIADLFAAAPVTTAAPSPGAPAPRPAAPQLPFRYLGRIVDGGDTAVFLINGQDHYNVKVGQVIDKTYKVERITESAVTFTYLPLGTRQMLAVPPLN